MMAINKLTGKTKEFAEACYEQNSDLELRATGAADLTDCREWDITTGQWYNAIDAALTDRLRMEGGALFIDEAGRQLKYFLNKA